MSSNSTNTPKSQNLIYISRLTLDDAKPLHSYLQSLSQQTRMRFGPHPFDLESIINILSDGTTLAYGAFEPQNRQLVAYALIRLGYLPWDKPRLSEYGIIPCMGSDCTFAPSVADLWQNSGMGSQLLNHILTDIPRHIKRIILWGGVQADNLIAVHFYQKNNFTILGEFGYYGQNYDMILIR